jgi:hypothetical protein
MCFVVGLVTVEHLVFMAALVNIDYPGRWTVLAF